MAGVPQNPTFEVDDGPDAHVDAEAAAIRLASICDRPITAATIRKWASRGKVRPTGSKGRMVLYSLRALEAYADALPPPRKRAT